MRSSHEFAKKHVVFSIFQPSPEDIVHDEMMMVSVYRFAQIRSYFPPHMVAGLFILAKRGGSGWANKTLRGKPGILSQMLPDL